MPVLIDSSSWVQTLRRKGDAATRERVTTLTMVGEARWCEMVRVELWHSVTGEGEARVLREMEAEIPMLEIDARVWEEACDLGRAAHRAGLVVPNPDLVIFACAKVHGVPLEHRDKHYDLLLKLDLRRNGG